MGYWLKKFADGTEVRGTDHAVAIRTASWSRSRLDSMVETELECQGVVLKLVGPGEFWQSDTLESTFMRPGSVTVRRRIERKIEPSDTHFRSVVEPKKGSVVFNGGLMVPDTFQKIKFQKIPKSWHGQWLILEYDLRTKKIRHYLRSERI